MRSAGIVPEIVFPGADLTGYDLVLAPRLCIHRSSIEVSLLAYLAMGGLLYATSDLFIKNNDNVFMTKVPELYRRVFGDDCVDFFYSDFQEADSETVASAENVVLISEHSPLEVWRHITEQFRDGWFRNRN